MRYCFGGMQRTKKKRNGTLKKYKKSFRKNKWLRITVGFIHTFHEISSDECGGNFI